MQPSTLGRIAHDGFSISHVHFQVVKKFWGRRKHLAFYIATTGNGFPKNIMHAQYKSFSFVQNVGQTIITNVNKSTLVSHRTCGESLAQHILTFIADY